MKTQELIEFIHASGGRLRVDGNGVEVKLPKGRMTPELRETLAMFKSQLLEALTTMQQMDASTARLARTHVALRIDSEEHGSVWLIGTEASRGLVDTADPVYTPTETRFLVELSPRELRMIHAFKRTFGGTIAIQKHADSEGSTKDHGVE